MTYLEVAYRYQTPPGEAELRAIDSVREVYGIQCIQFNEKERTVRVLFDASRLKQITNYFGVFGHCVRSERKNSHRLCPKLAEKTDGDFLSVAVCLFFPHALHREMLQSLGKFSELKNCLEGS